MIDPEIIKIELKSAIGYMIVSMAKKITAHIIDWMGEDTQVQIQFFLVEATELDKVAKRLVSIFKQGLPKVKFTAKRKKKVGIPVRRSKGVLEKRCILPYRELIIRSDGSVGLCHRSYSVGDRPLSLGTVNSEFLEDIWFGKRLNAMRSVLYRGHRQMIPCLYCGYSDSSEKAPNIKDLYPKKSINALKGFAYFGVPLKKRNDISRKERNETDKV